MMGRALSLAAATLFCCLATSPGLAQQNLDAGKSPAQIFSGNCGVCHRSAKGLLKSVSPSSLPDFLRQHYTTGGEMAQMLSGYLTSNRAAVADPDTGGGRRGGKSQGTLRPDAPVGGGPGAGSESGGLDQPRSDRRPGAASARPDEVEPAAAPATGRRRGRPESAPASAARPDEEAQPRSAGATPAARSRQARRGRQHREPPETSAPSGPEAVDRPAESPPKQAAQPGESERSIDARVPVPEPVELPPPTAADVKPAEPKAGESKPTEPRPEPVASSAAKQKAPSEKPVEAPPPAAPPADAAAPGGGPPTPPISQ